MSESDATLLDQVVARYIATRDRIAEIKAAADTQIDELKVQLDRAEGWLLQHLQTAGAKNIKCAAGTVYTEESLKASIGDWGALKTHIIKTGEVDLLEHRVSRVAVKEFMESSNGQLPPGVATRVERAVRVRRA